MVVKHRRNFLPTLIVNLLLWMLLAFIIVKVPPDFYNTALFFILLALSLTLTLALLLGNTRRGFFLALLFAGFLILRLVREASWLNLALLLAIFLTSELYFSRRKADN